MREESKTARPRQIAASEMKRNRRISGNYRGKEKARAGKYGRKHVNQHQNPPSVKRKRKLGKQFLSCVKVGY